MTDEELYDRCREYGALALLYRRKFIGLLPEVNRRHLFERKGFSSIFEFGFKLAGLSEDQVKRALRLDEQLEDKPLLHLLLTSGAVSMNKLARITSVATPENQDFWAEQVQNLPQKAVETLVRDQNVVKLDSVRAHHLKIHSDIEKELTELQEKGIDINQLLREFLKKRREEIENEKSGINPMARSRHIPKRIKNLLKKEYGDKCAIPSCKKPAEEIHHTHRYALSKNHNPYYLAPLCKQHHQIAHAIDQKTAKHFAPFPHPRQSAP